LNRQFIYQNTRMFTSRTITPCARWPNGSSAGTAGENVCCKRDTDYEAALRTRKTCGDEGLSVGADPYRTGHSFWDSTPDRGPRRFRKPTTYLQTLHRHRYTIRPMSSTAVPDEEDECARYDRKKKRTQ